MIVQTFNYERAFHRNVGWFTTDEQQSLRRKRVAVGGLGGCGGVHVTTLARLGIGAFNLADFDRFELANFNRQAGARMSTLGKPKLDVVRDMALDINPELNIVAFPEGIVDGSIDGFLQGVDVYVDAIDVFALETRRKVYARCRALGIPAVLSVPAGMGTVFFASAQITGPMARRCRPARPLRGFPIRLADPSHRTRSLSLFSLRHPSKYQGGARRNSPQKNVRMANVTS